VALMLDAVLFYAFAGLALASAVGVVAQKDAILSALSLIVTLCSLSAIFGLLGSPFIAALQIIVYAGAIMVLFLFVLMLLNVPRREQGHGGQGVLKGVATLLGLLFLVQVGAVVAAQAPTPVPAAYEATTQSVAQVLFSTRFLYVFEATSVLILAALVGAVALAKKDL
jgi:NADH-quinone oxidoreductase subunit J